MSKFKCVIMTIALFLVSTPTMAILANSGSTSTSFHSLVYGYSGGQHFTSYTIRTGKAVAYVWMQGNLSEVKATINGQTVRAAITTKSTTQHLHSWYQA